MTSTPTEIHAPRSVVSVAVLLSLVGFTLTPAAAQQVEQPRGIIFELTPYFWSFGISGEFAVEGQTVPVDYSASDLAKFTNTGFTGALELRERNLTLIITGTYLDASEDSAAVRLDFELLALDAFVGYRFLEMLDVMAGGRYYRTEAQIADNGSPTAEGSEDWIDLLVGARLDWDFSRKWWLRVRSDIGGSTAGSNLAWSLRAAVYYRLFDHLHLGFGYSILKLDYDKGGFFDRFAYDVTHTGPGLGMMFRID